MILPVEGVAAHVPRGVAVVALGVLEGVIAGAVIAAAGDGLVDDVPRLHLAAASVHHSSDPLLHSPAEHFAFLFACERGGLRQNELVAIFHRAYPLLHLNAAYPDISHEITALQQQEGIVDRTGVFYAHLFPVGGKLEVGVAAVAPVAQFRVHRAIFRAFDLVDKVIRLAGLHGDVAVGHELHFPGVHLLGCVDVKAVGGREIERETELGLIARPAYVLLHAEVFRRDDHVDHCVGVLEGYRRFILDEAAKPAVGLLRVPGERVTVDVDSGLFGGVDVLCDACEIHVAVIVDAAGHFHRVAGHSLRKVVICKTFHRRVGEVIIDCGADSQLKVGILPVVDVILQRSEFLQVIVIRIPRIPHLIIQESGLGKRSAHRKRRRKKQNLLHKMCSQILVLI